MHKVFDIFSLCLKFIKDFIDISISYIENKLLILH